MMFLSPQGDYHQAIGEFMATLVFNPLVESDMCSDQMVDILRDLCLLGFNEFCLGRGIIDNLIDELSSYRAVINPAPKYFWSEV